MQTTNRAIDGLVFENAEQVERLIIVNAPNMSFTTYLPVKRLLDGRSAPKRILSLAPNWVVPKPMEFERIDDRILRVTPDGGFPWLLTRSDDFPYPPGAEVVLTGVTIRIPEVHPESGYPMVVDYVFDVPLEDPTLAWRTVNEENRYVDWTPPAIGESLDSAL